jgi:glycerol uptake facilitator-like aquaporin
MASVEADSRSTPLAANVIAEALGTALLLTAVVGSGIMAERLTNDEALRLLCNTLATGATLFVAIMLFAPISGAHFNPAVTLVSVLQRSSAPWIAVSYLIAQVIGALAGVWLAHAMFGEPIFALGIKTRTGAAQWLSESVATFGLVLTIAGVAHRSRETIAASVALYIVAAYWFTASTSFANPAVTLARALTPTFSGIAPSDAPAFIAAQLLGAVLAWMSARVLFSGNGTKE